jgi:hypothetical protein
MPHAGNLSTPPAAADIPHPNLKLPAGFKAEVWSAGTLATEPWPGESGKVYVGTRGIAVSMKSPTTAASAPAAWWSTSSTSVAMHKGSLVMSIDKVLRYDGIEKTRMCSRWI